MNKFKLFFVGIIVIIIISFTGCRFDRPYSVSIYVDNETNKEYLIYYVELFFINVD